MVDQRSGVHGLSDIQRLCLGNRRMSAASIAAEIEGVGGSYSCFQANYDSQVSL